MPSLHYYLLSLFLVVTSTSAHMHINTTRVLSQLHHLATHNDLVPPSVQRIVYTPSDMSARAYLMSLFASANLSVQTDPLGNQFAIWYGSADSRLGAIATGSHIDAIPHSGMYDGTLGVIGAIEAIRALQSSGFVPKLDVHVIAFTSEEPTRFGIGCLGSRVMSNSLKENHILSLTDSDGVSLDTARQKAGFHGSISDVELSKDTYSAFIELHIEQSDTLEKKAVDIGAVTAIVAPAQVEVKFTGNGGHAGALPMNERNDASLAAAALALEVEQASLRSKSTYAVGTTGKFEIFPGATNSVPRVAKLGIDIRDVDLERRNGALDQVRKKAEQLARDRGVGLEFNVTNADNPAKCAEHIVNAIEKAAETSGLSAMRLVSRAYHDALFMARKFPTGMIFVPCKGGVSHRPDEFVYERDVENGVRVLAKTIAALAGGENEEVVHEEL